MGYTTFPEFDNFVVKTFDSKLEKSLDEQWMELEPFDSKLIKEIVPDDPFKILLSNLERDPPNYNRWKNEDIYDFYFKMLDDYNRYGIAFERKLNLFPDNNLYVIIEEKDNKTKYNLLYKYCDKKYLPFNKIKKINLNEYDSGEKILSIKEKQKRKFIKKQINKYLQVAMMDPDVFNDDELFEDLIETDDYNDYLIYNLPFISIEDFNNDKYFKKQFKKQLDMIRKLYDRIHKVID